MGMEDRYLDVLQNIEFAIVSVYNERNDLRDSYVMRALDALIDLYRRESRGGEPKKYNLREDEAYIFERVKNMCEFRLGRADSDVDMPDVLLGSVDISILRMRETQLLSGSGLKTETAFPNRSKACRD